MPNSRAFEGGCERQKKVDLHLLPALMVAFYDPRKSHFWSGHVRSGTPNTYAMRQPPKMGPRCVCVGMVQRYGSVNRQSGAEGITVNYLRKNSPPCDRFVRWFFGQQEETKSVRRRVAGDKQPASRVGGRWRNVIVGGKVKIPTMPDGSSAKGLTIEGRKTDHQRHACVPGAGVD